MAFRLFLRVFLSALICTSPALADTVPPYAVRQQILVQAVTDYQQHYPEVARARLRYLLRSSPDDQEEAYLLGLHDQIRREHPWFFSGGFSLRPSRNINQASSETVFKTLFGDLVITNGGKAKSGVGVSAYVEGGRGFVLGPGAEWDVMLNLGRTVYPTAAQSHTDARLALQYEKIGRQGDFWISPSLKFARYDAAPLTEPKIDYRQYGLALGGNRTLGGMRNLSAKLELVRTEYADRPYLDGNLVALTLGMSGVLDGGKSWNFGLNLGRAAPGVEHAVNNFASLQGGLEIPVGHHGLAGLSAEVGLAAYQADFPGLGLPRRDRTGVISLSY
ncbi:MAG: surface lipoprotein assembly modifier, partial [Rhodobacteraceae bacterium]|nr:surface lipoprotein assembly modifier [Paracoccaceae bacterium]